MKQLCAMTLGLFVLGFTGLQPSGDLRAQTWSPWTTLFDGKTLTGWNTVGDANWHVAEGEIQASKGKGFLVTSASYADFQVTAEFWFSDEANSGVFIRCQDPKKISASNAYEVNITDKPSDPTSEIGGVVDVVKPIMSMHVASRWNEYNIRGRARRLIVSLNGAKTVDVQDGKHARGPIALEYSGGTVKFRNIKIRTM